VSGSASGQTSGSVPDATPDSAQEMTPTKSSSKSAKQLVMPASLMAPSAVETHIKKGTKAFNRKDYKTAAHHFEKALKKSKKNHAVHYKLAVTYYCLRKFTAAKKHFLETHRLWPNYAKTLQYLGLTYYKLEDYDNAKKVWLKALIVDPDNKAVIDLLNLP